jgi:hypothetical protein
MEFGCVPQAVIEEDYPKRSLTGNCRHIKRGIDDYMRAKVLLNVIIILIAMGLAAYARNTVNEISATFTEVQVADAKFFSKLIRKNWEGIKTIPDEKKKVLLQNLDPALAAIDIRVMRTFILFLFYAIFGIVVIGRVAAIFKLWKTSRQG